ncbi:hypothetical protein [Mesonia sp. K7]|uniref:hypothetical protein n=1 Tax=Mesonia sp. K7 TaxID=2218606 RepID=UPI000DA77CA0|nr:hypothetical protein [Mesonia sp. K7]PZD77765.1 hypothetical protein DNG35_07975 [Mesonia sp. K7]
MIKKELFIGVLIALIVTIAGIFIYCTLFLSSYEFVEALKIAEQNDRLGSVIALGALANFLPFFVFLKKNQIYRARGVVMFCLLLVLFILLVNFSLIPNLF